VVGSLLHLTKHLRSDIANGVRELSKCMDGATPSAYKEMKRLVKFVVDTSDYGLKVKPSYAKGNKCKMTVFIDSDWAGDKNNRHSVSGYSMFLNGTVILCKSKLQKLLALSSSEAESYAMSEAAKDIKFVAMVPQSLGIDLELPIKLYCNNVGAIFMTENATATARTKHVGARYHYEFVIDGLIKVIFVRSADNISDMFAKNVFSELYQKHKGDYIARINDLETMWNVKGRVSVG
jgi:hypothetical protein